MVLILPIADTCVNYGRGYCSSSRAEQKPLSDFKNSFPFGRNHSRKTDWLKLPKNGFYFWEGGFGGGKVVFRPPGVVSGIGRGGSEFTIR
jgi:hypothetical protein